MDIYLAFIIYLLFYRLAIIAAGIVSIVLGYRLFIKGVFPIESKGTTEVGGTFGEVKFTLKNAAPGTVFALFGIVLISVMLVKLPPELITNDLKKSFSSLVSEKNRPVQVKIRGEAQEEVKALIEKQLSEIENLKSLMAKKEYEKAILLIAQPMNAVAWRYYQEGKLDEALSISRIAVSLSPEYANFLDTLGEILFAKKSYSAALEVMEKAAKLDKQYEDKLPKFRERATQ